MVERHLAKVNVASSNLVFRSRKALALCRCFFYRIGIYEILSRATFVLFKFSLNTKWGQGIDALKTLFNKILLAQ